MNGYESSVDPPVSMKLNESLLGFKYVLSSELDAGKDTKLKR